MFSSASLHCLISLSLDSFIDAAAAAWPATTCFFMSSILASRALCSATASQVPTLRPVMVAVKSPCLPPFCVMVLLNSVWAALYCWSITIVLPSLQDSVTVVRVAVRLLSVTLQSRLFGSWRAARSGSSPWQERCGFIMPAGMPGTFMVISHSSPSAAATDEANASNAQPSRLILISNPPLEPSVHSPTPWIPP